MRVRDANTGILGLPYVVDHERLGLRASELRLAEVIADAYVDPDAVLRHAATSSSYLLSLLDQGVVVGFAFVRLHEVCGERVSHLALLGISPAHRAGSITLTLLAHAEELLGPARGDVVWTATAQPTVARIWRRHFGDHELAAHDEAQAALATALWASLGATTSSDAGICRGGFPHQLTPSELTLIARTNRAFPGDCAALDADAGDRLLLLARR